MLRALSVLLIATLSSVLLPRNGVDSCAMVGTKSAADCPDAAYALPGEEIPGPNIITYWECHITEVTATKSAMQQLGPSAAAPAAVNRLWELCFGRNVELLARCAAT